MNQLLQKLRHGDHPVEVSLRPNRTPNAFKECIDRGFVHVRFTDTDGGTELGVRLDKTACDLNADFELGTGKIKLIGNLTLDYVKVQCIADIELQSLAGKGYLITV